MDSNYTYIIVQNLSYILNVFKRGLLLYAQQDIYLIYKTVKTEISQNIIAIKKKRFLF